MIFLGHHPINNVGTAASSGTGSGAWILVGIFVLIFIGAIYWMSKRKI